MSKITENVKAMALTALWFIVPFELLLFAAGLPNEHLHFKGAIFQLKNLIKEFLSNAHFFVFFKITPCYQNEFQEWLIKISP